ncbi:MAG: hypothetical protein M1840_002956 [Geoglossum simile]|nr:MAG: hypothetical protein M1840_002956 [Geoglossum simile]
MAAAACVRHPRGPVTTTCRRLEESVWGRNGQEISQTIARQLGKKLGTQSTPHNCFRPFGHGTIGEDERLCLDTVDGGKGTWAGPDFVRSRLPGRTAAEDSDFLAHRPLIAMKRGGGKRNGGERAEDHTPLCTPDSLSKRSGLCVPSVKNALVLTTHEDSSRAVMEVSSLRDAPTHPPNRRAFHSCTIQRGIQGRQQSTDIFAR